MSPCDLVLLITMKHHWFLCLNRFLSNYLNSAKKIPLHPLREEMGGSLKEKAKAKIHPYLALSCLK